MTHEELTKATDIALSRQDLNWEDTQIFHGYGLSDFKPVTCSLHALAALIRWECVCFNGELDNEALTAIARLGRRRFLVVAKGGA